MNKKHLHSIHNYNLNIDLKELQNACDKLAEKFVDVKTANPNAVDNQGVSCSVYDNFEQINLTTPMKYPHTASIKERLKRKEEHLYNVITEDYTGSYFEKIITQLKAQVELGITKLAP